jgi:hypothetical protein
MNPRQAVSPALSTKQGATGHTDTKDINPIQRELKLAGIQKNSHDDALNYKQRLRASDQIADSQQ